jgi:hypothetical protein
VLVGVDALGLGLVGTAGVDGVDAPVVGPALAGLDGLDGLDGFVAEGLGVVARGWLLVQAASRTSAVAATEPAATRRRGTAARYRAAVPITFSRRVTGSGVRNRSADAKT